MKPTSRPVSFTAALSLALAMPLPARAELSAEQRTIPLETLDPNTKGPVVLLLAGSPSNKPGQHEYFAGCTLMANWLRQNGAVPVQAAEGWPKDERLLEKAQAIVVYADGGPKLPFLNPERFQKMREAIRRGAGLVMLHQSVDVPATHAQEIGDWLGAVFQTGIGCRGHWDMDFASFPIHPATRGVTPFSAPLDGWLYNLQFRPGVVPLASGAVPDKSRSTPDAKSHAGRDEVIGWAYERPGGGRSFGFTGCDLHRNWGVEGQRRLVLNGVLWTAGLLPEAGGARVENPPADLTRWLDPKAEGKATP
ncbi:MAG: hypothetical protein RLZZ142_808 [Verrucomicrobiota bacterium]|jgi:hypothetical protein